MRVLNILAGLLLITAGLCLGQNPPTPPTPGNAATPAASPGDPALHEKLEEFKAEYGKAQLNEHSVTEVFLQPKPGVRSFTLTGDTRTLYNTIASAFGVRVVFDESTPTKSARLNLLNVDFRTAITTVGLVTHTFWKPVSADEFMVAADTVQKRRDLMPMLQRTFYLSDAVTATDLQDIVNVLRTVFEIRYVVQQPGTNSVTIRADQNTVHAVEQLLAGMDLSRPQVTLNVQAYEVDSTMQRNLGISMPLQFQMFNIPSGVLELLNTPGIQDLISQIAQSGGLTGANSSTISALLGQYQNQLQALLANPVATFGGGLTFMGFGIPPGTANMSLNQSNVTTLENVTLQAAQGDAATIHIGNRYPIITQSFSSGINVTGLNIGVTGAIPGVSYEDLGVTLKAKPVIHGSSAVTLDTEMSIKSLGAQSVNSIPIIQNREYKGMITVKDGEPAVLVGLISKTEQKSLAGPPGIGSLPVLNKLVSNEVKMDDKTELIIIVTPHITRTRRTETPIILSE